MEYMLFYGVGHSSPGFLLPKKIPFSINSVVPRFFLTEDLTFSRFIRSSEIFSKIQRWNGMLQTEKGCFLENCLQNVYFIDVLDLASLGALLAETRSKSTRGSPCESQGQMTSLKK